MTNWEDEIIREAMLDNEIPYRLVLPKLVQSIHILKERILELEKEKQNEENN